VSQSVLGRDLVGEAVQREGVTVLAARTLPEFYSFGGGECKICLPHSRWFWRTSQAADLFAPFIHQTTICVAVNGDNVEQNDELHRGHIAKAGEQKNVGSERWGQIRPGDIFLLLAWQEREWLEV